MHQLRDAARALRATPLVTAVAVLSLALGIGANTAMFSIVDALVLRALPVRHAERLSILGDKRDVVRSWTNPIWESVRSRANRFDGAFAYGDTRFDLAQSGAVDAVDGLRASGGMFDVLGVNAAVGRTFSDADDRAGGGIDGPVAVISYAFWQRRFGAASDIIGRSITLNRVPFTIIGVTEQTFFGPEVGHTFDVAIPIGSVSLLRGSQGLLTSRDSWWLRIMIRLAPGQTAEQATSALRAVQTQIADETRPTAQRSEQIDKHLSSPFALSAASTGSSSLRDQYQRPLFLLIGIVALTLLIACGNIANLLLARAASRRHEFSVRTALGASPGTIAAQLLAESLMLSVLGAAFGVIIAIWGGQFIVNQLSTSANHVFLDIGVNWRVLAFTTAVAMITALLFGIVPALRSAGVAPIEAMKEQGRAVSSRRSVGLAGSLVVAQVALSLVLLVGSGLFVRSFQSLASLNLGFDSKRVLVVNINAQNTGLDSAARAAMYDQLVQQVRAVPGVTNAALSVTLPVGDNTLIRMMDFPGRPELPEQERIALRNFVSAGFFATLGTRFVAGRDFDGRDRVGAPRTVVVNQAFAVKYFGAENPLGKIIIEHADATSDPAPIEIIGVVTDAVYRSLRAAPPPTMYWPITQLRRPSAVVKLTVRGVNDAPATLTKSVFAVVAGVNPAITMESRTLADQISASITQERLLAKLAGFFGALALLLAALGLYGVTSYAVSRRQKELGIRMALGSSPFAIVRDVLVRVSLLVGGGIAIGSVISWWGGRFVETLLFGLAPRDPATIAASITVLTAFAFFAGWLPARRAARTDPATVLRDG